MTNSKRKRKAIFARRGNINELEGFELPEHLKNIKNPQKHFCSLDFNNEVGKLFAMISELSNVIGNPTIHEDERKQAFIFYEQMFIARGTVIEYFVILDRFINRILALYQFNLGIDGDKSEDFTEVDEGILKFLPKENLPIGFDSVYSRMKHFKVLRNQFSHYPYGYFSMGANKESFESFLGTLKGIKLDSDGGYYVFINGKAGIHLPYHCESSDYLLDLHGTGAKFFNLLLDIFLPDPLPT
jgi:hypothetical protein